MKMIAILSVEAGTGILQGNQSKLVKFETKFLHTSCCFVYFRVK